MNIDFIKWKVEKADGFQILYQEHEDRIQLPTGDQIGIDELEEDYWFKSIVDPLLTQRAIEGVNRENGDNTYFITQNPCDIAIGKNECELVKVIPEWEAKGDEAKESALMCIYEQEKEIMKKEINYHGMPVTVEYSIQDVNIEGLEYPKENKKIGIGTVSHCGGLLNDYFETQHLWDDLEDVLFDALKREADESSREK